MPWAVWSCQHSSNTAPEVFINLSYGGSLQKTNTMCVCVSYDLDVISRSGDGGQHWMQFGGEFNFSFRGVWEVEPHSYCSGLPEATHSAASNHSPSFQADHLLSCPLLSLANNFTCLFFFFCICRVVTVNCLMYTVYCRCTPGFSLTTWVKINSCWEVHCVLCWQWHHWLQLQNPRLCNILYKEKMSNVKRISKTLDVPMNTMKSIIKMEM